MSIQTITFDSKNWRLVPKVATDEWLNKVSLPILAEDVELINALLASAPQPPTIGIKNDYGLDANYFVRNFRIVIRDIEQYSPAELRRALTKLAAALPQMPEVE